MKTKVTEIRFFPLAPSEKGLIGIVSCVINNNFKFDGIGVYSRPDGSDFRMVFPKIRLPHGLMPHAFFPINREASNDLKEALTERIREIISGQKVNSDNNLYSEPDLSED